MKKALVATVAMLIGGLLYISLRSESLAMFRWFAMLGVQDEVHAVRALTSAQLGRLPGWVYLSLPQALWYFSGLLGFECIWSVNAATTRERRAWILAFSGLALGLEIGQWLGLVPGRFDPLDLVLLLVAWSVAAAISSLGRRRLLNSQIGDL